MGSSLTYRRLRAARHDGGIVMQPPAQLWPALPQRNQRQQEACCFELLGDRDHDVRTAARHELIQLATEHTRKYADAESPSSGCPIVMSGHQPELFHPGVWAKNFVADWLAEQIGGLAIHVIVDNDLMRHHAVRLPTGTVETPRVVAEPFDRFQEPRPYEHRHVLDSNLVASFAKRVASRLVDIFPEQLLVSEMWPDVVAAVEMGRPLGHAFAQGRHRRELDWGLHTWEVPLSQLCETATFRRFVIDLLQRGEQVRECFNRRLAEYRQLHRIRTAAQPLPNLGQREAWTESPFWFWTDQQPQRCPLWFSHSGSSLQIGQPGAPIWTFEGTEHSPPEFLQQFAELSQRGVRVRPRALTTTMFLRLFLCDLFVHGIGGGKYDQLTDVLIEDLYQVTPPEFAVLSQTTWLPVDFARVSQDEITKKRQELREMYFHPERFLDPQVSEQHQVSSWLQTKQRAIGDDPPRSRRQQRHEQIVHANAKLRGYLQEKHDEQKQTLAALLRRQPVSQLWSSREWSYVLFPANFLRARLLDLRFPMG